MQGMLRRNPSVNFLILFAADSSAGREQAVSWQDVHELREAAAIAMMVSRATCARRQHCTS